MDTARHIIPMQPQYNLLHRTRFEVEYQPLYAQYGMGVSSCSMP